MFSPWLRSTSLPLYPALVTIGGGEGKDFSLKTLPTNIKDLSFSRKLGIYNTQYG
jgi:hypothetical protein